MPPDILVALISEGADIHTIVFNEPRKYRIAVETYMEDTPVYVECYRDITMITGLHLWRIITLTLRKSRGLWLRSLLPNRLLNRPPLEDLRLDASKALEATCDRYHGDVDVTELLSGSG